MSAVENALVVPAPRKSIVLPVSATVTAFSLPTTWASCWVECHNDSNAKMGIIFGTSEAEVSAMTNLVVESTIDGAGAANQPTGVPGAVIEIGERMYYSLAEVAFMPGELNSNSLIWCAFVGAGTVGGLRLTKSSGFVR